MSTLIESETYLFAKSLLGTAESADELLGRVEGQIATSPEKFPLVALPDTRLATDALRLRGQKVRIGIFFQQIDADQIELLSLCLNEERSIQPFFAKPSLHLPLAA